MPEYQFRLDTENRQALPLPASPKQDFDSLFGKHIVNGDAHAADARLPTPFVRFNGDNVSIVHLYSPL